MLAPPAAAPETPPTEADPAAVSSTDDVAAAAPLADADSLEPPADLFTPPGAPGKYKYVWVATGIAALLLVSAGSYLTKRRITPSAIPAHQVGLRFQGPANRLQLVWNPQSALVRGAESAQLRIIDAESDRAELVTPDSLTAGRMNVINRTGQIEARLRLIPRETSAPVATVVAQFIGPSSSEMQMREVRGVSNLSPLLKELQGLRASIQSAIEGNRGLTNRIADVRNSMAARLRGVAEKVPQPALAAANPGGTSLPAPAPATLAGTPPPSPQQPAATAPAQSPANAPVIGAPGPSFGTDRVPARATQLPEPPPAPVYTGPATGKLIWSGFLAPGATVTIDGRRASSGSVNSILPGVPVRLAVYPAEFSAGGLVIYSASPRHQSGNVTEARSAQNGWLAVRYVYDPARARDVQLAATPNSAGAFKQLQIRGGERPVSVAVIEWAVSQ